MCKVSDLIEGQKVLGTNLVYLGKASGIRKSLVRCTHGNVYAVETSNLTGGNTTSCHRRPECAYADFKIGQPTSSKSYLVFLGPGASNRLARVRCTYKNCNKEFESAKSSLLLCESRYPQKACQECGYKIGSLGNTEDRSWRKFFKKGLRIPVKGSYIVALADGSPANIRIKKSVITAGCVFGSAKCESIVKTTADNIVRGHTNMCTPCSYVYAGFHRSNKAKWRKKFKAGKKIPGTFLISFVDGNSQEIPTAQSLVSVKCVKFGCCVDDWHEVFAADIISGGHRSCNSCGIAYRNKILSARTKNSIWRTKIVAGQKISGTKLTPLVSATMRAAPRRTSSIPFSCECGREKVLSIHSVLSSVEARAGGVSSCGCIGKWQSKDGLWDSKANVALMDWLRELGVSYNQDPYYNFGTKHKGDPSPIQKTKDGREIVFEVVNCSESGPYGRNPLYHENLQYKVSRGRKQNKIVVVLNVWQKNPKDVFDSVALPILIKYGYVAKSIAA